MTDLEATLTPLSRFPARRVSHKTNNKPTYTYTRITNRYTTPRYGLSEYYRFDIFPAANEYAFGLPASYSRCRPLTLDQALARDIGRVVAPAVGE